MIKKKPIPLPKEKQEVLDKALQFLKEKQSKLIGYPCSTDFDFSEIYPFLSFPLNNVGDPFHESSYGLNTRSFEVEVLNWYADLLKAPKNEWWGYVNNGGTEGNLYGLYLARELYPNGIVYYSESTHYSVSKNLQLLRMPHILIRSQENGEIDYEHLSKIVNINNNTPAIFFANVGTTMTEAIDDIPKAKEIFNQHQTPYYIHVDAALSGITLPFIENPPAFDFSSGIHSISCSGHKFLGSSLPCGVVLVQKHAVSHISKSIEYVATLDTTITGSRNAISPLVLWETIHKYGLEGLRKRVQNCLKMVEYVIEELGEIGVESWRNPYAITAVFPKPSQKILDKWFMAVADGISHIICVPSTTKEVIDEFVNDMKTELKK